MGKDVIRAHCYSHPQVLCVRGFLSGTLLTNSFNFFFNLQKFFFFSTPRGMWDLPLPEIEPRPPALEAQS